MKKLRVRRSAGLLVASLVLAGSAAGTAGAAAPGPDLAAAKAAAHSAAAGQLIAKAAERLPQTAAKAGTVVQQDAVPVYALNPEFVAGKSADVASLWYVATSASKGGAAMTVYTAPDAAGTWQAVNVASGNTESKMAGAAKGAKLFTEPQIGAWYALSGDRVRALNPSATEAIGAQPISVAAYQEKVTSRYGDKQAGSAYHANGTAGGYDVNAATADSSFPLVQVAAGGGVLLLGAYTLVLYRRKNA
ncbi:hypothetical protein [Kribbella italica]|uniref:LPXTG cell wall anchor domain-containing protein n=1 Tax=Kribbella italica TaxID=1540520 RepID=A0A7W9MUG7_9ACTN|nr:hypothetical protein [Kribbella italica]MBB5835938.1 hypothetical protein [Kribbella italica]